MQGNIRISLQNIGLYGTVPPFQDPGLFPLMFGCVHREFIYIYIYYICVCFSNDVRHQTVHFGSRPVSTKVPKRIPSPQKYPKIKPAESPLDFDSVDHSALLYLSIHPTIYPSIYPSIYISIYIYIYIYLYQSISSYINLFICMLSCTLECVSEIAMWTP